ncbi:flagellar basal body-associated FliL family protein [uncultured Algimonas sp.]|uniref:flagellar basal body-associated FliL family protein n=1 Tax=uncultured Algimonas sp. TaxID=1547920 RepID=UPI002606A41D|nr:flagellar basal body-associated FliL family protein [uncultured Algimonas sp.]
MALLKKKKGDPALPASGDASGKGSGKSKGGLILAVLAPVLVFAAAFGASWFMGEPPAPPPAPAPAPTAATHSADWTPSEPARTLALDTMVLTAGPKGQTLRIGLAIEVWDDTTEIDAARLRDVFTTYLRALDPAQLSDPSFHVRLKRALVHRARVVAGQDVVADVLITDFLLTS